MVDGNERAALPLRLHRVLLGLAGRLDDTALGQARRLAARARIDEAAELIGGALIAGGIPVRPGEQEQLAAVLAATGAEGWFAGQLRVVADLPPAEHRFSSAETAATGVAAALDLVLRRLPDIRRVYAVWRNSVAGSAFGPMPQRVVLAEVGPAGSALATAYRMDSALRRAGIHAAIEVLEAEADWPEYHRQALRWANLIAEGSAAAFEDVPAQQQLEPAPHQDEFGNSEDVESPLEPSDEAPPTDEPGPQQWPEPPPEVAYQEREPVTQWPETPAEPEQPFEDWPQAPAETVETVERPDDVEQSAEVQEDGAEDAAVWPTHGEFPQPPPPRAPREQAELPAQYTETRWATQLPPIHVVEPSGGNELEPGELFWPQAESAVGHQTEQQEEQRSADHPEEPEQDEAPAETRAEQTTEMSASEQEALRTAIAAHASPEQTTAADAAEQTDVDAPTRVTEPATFTPRDLDNPQLSVRDRELLRELHEELAKREQSAQVRLNGWEPGAAR